MSEISAAQDLKAIRIIMPLHREGLSNQQVADKLNEMGIINSIGIPFKKQKVSDLLAAGRLLEASQEQQGQPDNDNLPEEILNSELTEDESKRLYECEIIIKTGMQTFIEVGRALTEIRNKQLFRKDFKTFDEYCKTKWKFDKTYASRLINSRSVINNLLPIGNTLPESESQTRELLKLSPDEQKEVWQKVVEVSELLSKPITAALVRQEVEKFKTPEPVIREVIKEIEIIKDPNPEIQKELQERTKDVVELEDILEKKDIQVLKLGNEKDDLAKKNSALFLEKKSMENEIKDYQMKIDEMEQKLKKIGNSSDESVQHWKNEVKKMQSEMETNKTKIAELEKFKNDHRESEQILLNIAELKKKQTELFSDSENLNKVAGVYVKVRDYFQKEVFYLAGLELRPGTKEAMQKEIKELIEMIDNCSFVMKNKFIANNQNENSLVKMG